MALADELEGVAELIHSSWAAGRPWLTPARYATQCLRTWRAFGQHNPETVVVITPPFPAPLTAWIWCALNRRQLVVDCHTETFHSRKWGWAAVLQRPIFRAARAVLVHTHDAEALVRSWGAPALLLPDDLPAAPPSTAVERSPLKRVVIAGGLDAQEPVAQTLEAAALLPDVEVRVTGEPSRLPHALRDKALSNVVFTGYLAYPAFLQELLEADVVAAFSLDRHIMNRAAFEAIALGRPLVLSDWPLLRDRFGSAALFTPNRAFDMAAALRQALDAGAVLSERSSQLRQKLREQHRSAVCRLEMLLSDTTPSSRVSATSALRHQP